MWNLITVHLETMLVSVQDRCTVCTKHIYHRLKKSFWTDQMVLLGYEAQLEAHFGLFGDNANLHAR